MGDYETTAYQKDEPVADINLKNIINFIWKSFTKLWWLPIELAIIVGAVFWYRGYVSYSPTYQTSAVYMVESATESYSSEYRNATTTAQVVNTFSYILKSTSLKDMVLEQLDMSYMPATFSASVMGSTNMMTLTASGSNPALTYQTLNAVVELFPEAAKELVGAVQFKIVDIPAIPTAPVNQSQAGAQGKKGAMLGGLVGLAVILAYACTRNTILGTDTVAKYTRLACLGEVEAVTFKKRKKSENPQIIINGSRLPSSFRETYRSIRTKVIGQCEKHAFKTLLITSTYPGEGKTTSAFNTALSLANAGNSVVLVDCDFRKPSQYKIFESSEAEKVDLPKILGSNEEPLTVFKSEADGIYKIFNKVSSSSVTDIVEHERLKLVLDYYKDQMDYVIIDTSPMALVSDAEELAQIADASILIVRRDVVHTRYINDTIDALNNTKAKVIGCVFNDAVIGAVSERSSYGRGNYYGYGGHYEKGE